ncbi:lysophospholipase [Actinoplanes bogorensis]|uniref:Lysophospholipase n=1 Tax=Paractinoplanes bogorensis TaxID=1610840 RepID=A0ABS5YQI8_9ACTN|nr:alpha/beta fold hydrolase [Actinoplanes bogorensis]MBU2664275.1 lysophospholipase [Actinoplanes bogorensis]
MTSSQPSLTVFGPASAARAVVLVLHGGRVTGTGAAPRGLAWARMLPFARAGYGDGVAGWLLRNRVRGWNGAAEDPVRDARWALAEARRRHPGAPVVLVGHSMGGRVALRLAADPDVAGVCALAPWIENGDPAVRGKAVLIAHGQRDRITDPAASAAYAARIGATYVPIAHDGHAMLRRPLLWQRLVTGFVADTAVAGPRHTDRPPLPGAEWTPYFTEPSDRP